MSITMSALRQSVADIKERFPQPPKDHTLKLLKEIYKLNRRIGDPASSHLNALLKDKHQDMHHNVKKDSFRILIELTSAWIDPRLKSRYANALMFAYKNGAKPNGFIKFMKRHGGIEECDKKFRARQAKLRKA